MLIKSNIKQIVRKGICARKRAHWKAPSHRKALSKHEKQQVEMIWGGGMVKA